MIFLLLIIAWGTLDDATGKLDKHPVQPSAYVALAVGVICLIGAIAGWLQGRSLDE